MASIARRPDGTYRPRYRDQNGKEHARHFKKKVDAQRWLDEVTAAMVAGTYVDPKTAKTTVADWCDTRLAGYATRRPRTVRQAEVHAAQIKMAFGRQQLAAVRLPRSARGQPSSRPTAWPTPTSTRCTRGCADLQ